uniref:Uncharacterized protein n=1 Tax=Parascaris univalens TaxID=6257 RepID=A0A915CIS7_PARUN
MKDIRWEIIVRIEDTNWLFCDKIPLLRFFHFVDHFSLVA